MVLSKVLGVWGSASCAGEAEVWEWDRNQARRKWDFVLLGCVESQPLQQRQGAGLGLVCESFGSIKVHLFISTEAH